MKRENCGVYFYDVYFIFERFIFNLFVVYLIKNVNEGKKIIYVK